MFMKMDLDYFVALTDEYCLSYAFEEKYGSIDVSEKESYRQVCDLIDSVTKGHELGCKNVYLSSLDIENLDALKHIHYRKQENGSKFLRQG